MKYPKNGRFGEFGGRYIPETLVPAIEELEENYLKFKNDKEAICEITGVMDINTNAETAALVVVANAMLNLDEWVNKN